MQLNCSHLLVSIVEQLCIQKHRTHNAKTPSKRKTTEPLPAANSKVIGASSYSNDTIEFGFPPAIKFTAIPVNSFPSFHKQNFVLGFYFTTMSAPTSVAVPGASLSCESRWNKTSGSLLNRVFYKDPCHKITEIYRLDNYCFSQSVLHSGILDQTCELSSVRRRP